MAKTRQQTRSQTPGKERKQLCYSHGMETATCRRSADPKARDWEGKRSSTNDSLTTEMAAAAREKGQDQEGGMPGSTFMSWPAEATEVRPRISPEAPSDQGGWEARPGGESVHRPPAQALPIKPMDAQTGSFGIRLAQFVFPPQHRLGRANGAPCERSHILHGSSICPYKPKSGRVGCNGCWVITGAGY